MKRFLLCFLLFAALTRLNAQGEPGTHFQRGTWQAMNTNPALIPEGRFVIKLPDIYNDIYLSSLTYADLIVKGEGGKNYLDIDRAIGFLDDRNLIREQLQIGTLGVGLNLGMLSLNLQHSMRYQAFLNYPKTLPQLIWQGNAQFIGQEVDASTDLELFGYHEVALGGALSLGEVLTLGARVKWLGGIANVSTPRHQFRLHTDSTAYALTLDADLLVNSSGAVTYNGFQDLSVDFNFGRFDLEGAFRNNYGYALDFGAQLKLGKLDLTASVLDLGKITWKGEARNYAVNGTFEFAGLDVAQGIFEDSTDFGSILDTLESIVEVVSTNESFTSELAPQYYLSAGYQLNDTWRLGALFYSRSFRGESFPSFAAGANARILPFLELGATYAWRSEAFDNFGLNAVFRAGPLQVVASTDNIITAWKPRGSHSANIRLGVNLVMGERE